jgi:hypothetical protein
VNLRTLLTAVLLGAAACSRATQSAPAGPSPDELLQRAIERAGGADALNRARAVEWVGEATVHDDDRVVRIAGTWSVQPPDTAVVSTYDPSQGRHTTRSMVLAVPRGWLVNGREFSPMSPALLARERAEFYFYQLFRLVPLLGSNVTRSLAEPDSLGQVGIRVEEPGHPAAFLYFSRDGQLAHVRMQVPGGGGEPEWQDAWLAGLVESKGMRWPRELHLLIDGQPYFDLTIESFRALPKLESPLLSGPR